MLRAFIKDSAIYAIPAFISRGLALFLIPLYTRVLSPADFGSLDLLLVFAAIINLTIALEVSQGVARFYASEPDPVRKVAYASSAFWFTLVCYSALALLMLFLSPHLADLIMGQPGLERAFQLGIAYIWVNGIFYLVQNQFRWELRSKHYAIVSLLMAFVTAAVSVWLAYFLNLGLLGLLSGMVAGCLTATALGLWWLRKSFRFCFEIKRLKEMLAFSTPLVFSGIAVWVSLYVDRMMINHLLSIEDVGLYGIGHRLASIAGLVMVGFQGALTPLVYAHYQNPDTPRQLERIFRLFLSFALLVFLALTLFAVDILVLMTTPAFYGGAVVVIFLVPAILLGNMYIFSPGITIAKKMHLIVWINVGGGLFNVSLNYLLIPRMGIMGAGMATMLSYLVIFSAYTVIGQRFYSIPHNWLKISVAVALAGTLAVAVPQLSQTDAVRWGLNLAVLFIFVPTLVAIGLIRRDELSAAWQHVQVRLSSTRA
jgi:O-antigen/teichoic acid export membrane protein